jgi:hypothetical protein
MSLLNKEPKVKKTENKTEYFKEYREKNGDHLKTLDRMKYYTKKYELEEDFLAKFGEYSGDVFKLLKTFKKLETSAPELKPHILKLLE